jgi:class 3 adenylate cyclase
VEPRRPADASSKKLAKDERGRDWQQAGPRSREAIARAADKMRSANRSPNVIDMVRRARRVLPGDPGFGDSLSIAGDGGPSAAARATARMMGGNESASQQLSLAGLQVWQALADRVERRSGDRDVTLVFTDLVGFSAWSLQAGDTATVTLLRRVARAVEPLLMDRGGRIVKRMGDGIMAAFDNPTVALAAVVAADEALLSVEVNGYTPRMRVGIHTGRPRRLGDDLLGVDVNIAARVMEQAADGGLVISDVTLSRISNDHLAELGVSAESLPGELVSGRVDGVPPGMMMYRLNTSERSRRSRTHDSPTDSAIG